LSYITNFGNFCVFYIQGGSKRATGFGRISVGILGAARAAGIAGFGRISVGILGFARAAGIAGFGRISVGILGAARAAGIAGFGRISVDFAAGAARELKRGSSEF
jgi:hypothetical protein